MASDSFKYARSKRYEITWYEETLITLGIKNKFIKFEAIDYFRKNFTKDFLTNNKVYYFTNTIHSHKSFNIYNLLYLGDDNLKFLIENRIPLIIDTSMEQTDLHTLYVQLENASQEYLFNLDQLHLIFVHGTYFHNIEEINKKFSNLRFKRIENIFHTTSLFFPLKNQKDKIKERSKSIEEIINLRQITNTSKDFFTRSLKPRLNRTLFFAKLFDSGLDNNCIYTMVRKGKKNYLDDLEFLGISNKKELNLITDNSTLNKLDNTKTIDYFDERQGFENCGNVDLYATYDNLDFCYYITLETFRCQSVNEFYSTNTMLTEKSFSPIFNGFPSFNIGGQHSRKILDFIGLERFPEFPTSSHPCISAEIEEAIEFIKYFSKLSIEEKKDRYNYWKNIALKNFFKFVELDPAEMYVKCLNKEYTDYLK